MVIDSRNSNVLYAAAYDGGVYKSTDGGESWVEQWSGMADPRTRTLAINPRNPNEIYAGHVNVAGLYKTGDGGRRWRKVRVTVESLYDYNFTAVAIAPSDPRVVYIGTHDPPGDEGIDRGIFKTIDSGRTWRKLSAGAWAEEIADLAVDPQDSNVVYAASYTQGVYKSIDGGWTWQSLNRGLPSREARALALHPQTPNVVFVVLEGAVARSQDGGRSWTVVYRGADLTTLELASSDPDVMYLGALGDLFKPADGGRTWDLAAGPVPNGHLSG